MSMELLDGFHNERGMITKGGLWETIKESLAVMIRWRNKKEGNRQRGTRCRYAVDHFRHTRMRDPNPSYAGRTWSNGPHPTVIPVR